jgi:DhnA family fructose-bisphosphate aldolase class Ia
MGSFSAQTRVASHDRSPSAAPAHVQVIATSDAGTRAALLEARQLARRLDLTKVVLLVPRVASSTASVEKPDVDTAMVERYRRIASLCGVDVIVRLCVCGTLREAFQWMLPRGCVVVVGGQRRWWWPTREQRIADLLKKTGHVIVFAEASELHTAR